MDGRLEHFYCDYSLNYFSIQSPAARKVSTMSIETALGSESRVQFHFAVKVSFLLAGAAKYELYLHPR
jgi:hypothetical protein